LTRRRLDARVAVDILNTSVNPVRKGIQCVTLESKREEGRVYGWLDDDQDTGGTVESGTLIFAKDAIVAELRERVASLERQLETRSEEVWRKDHIIAALTQRIPELSVEAHQERAQDVAQGAGGVRGSIRVWRPYELRWSPCEHSELVAKNFRRRLERSVVVRSTYDRWTCTMKDEDLST
jgi:hypothetical protein